MGADPKGSAPIFSAPGRTPAAQWLALALPPQIRTRYHVAELRAVSAEYVDVILPGFRKREADVRIHGTPPIYAEGDIPGREQGRVSRAAIARVEPPGQIVQARLDRDRDIELKVGERGPIGGNRQLDAAVGLLTSAGDCLSRMALGWI
ncbi:MAG: hypothetical protein QOK07_3161 [Gemmatimonadaceae bacterium]|nr:hypothetical protein [Gemmatimonadaceae bacterium]